ncbi:MAG: hypothetical protein JWQ09_4413 [Segetibacter sp.]|nr:hypothetical protein [Segetibacter sp.]
MTTTEQIFAANQLLTLDIATQLKGKRIVTTSPEYHANKLHIHEFKVGEIVSSWEDAKNRKYVKQNNPNHFQYDTFQDYWASYMNERQIKEEKDKLILFSNEGERMCVAHTGAWNMFDEPTFTGSDADRAIYFLEV